MKPGIIALAALMALAATAQARRFPQRQKAASFNLDDVVEQLEKPSGG